MANLARIACLLRRAAIVHCPLVLRCICAPISIAMATCLGHRYWQNSRVRRPRSHQPIAKQNSTTSLDCNPDTALALHSVQNKIDSSDSEPKQNQKEIEEA